MILPLKTVLIIHVALFGYTWCIYPVLLAILAKMFPASPRADDKTQQVAEESYPYVAIIIAAFNEDSVIAERINNLKEVDYPADKIAVYVGCDGCTDSTVDVAMAAAGDDPNFNIIDFKKNSGKVTVLRELVAKAQEGPDADVNNALLIFSDANTMFATDAIKQLVRHFEDDTIGGVCGRLAFVLKGDASENPAEEGAYWKLETKLKTWESALDSCLGANGAIYAIRSELFWQEIPENIIVDDLVIGMKVRGQGVRMIYDPKALATEVMPDVGDEWVRRVRIGAGDYQAAVICKECLNPRMGWFAWAFWSHKMLRWFTPHIMIVLGISSYILGVVYLLQHDTSPVACLSYIVAIGGSALLIAGYIGRIMSKRKCTGVLAKILAICDHFITMNAALFMGFIRFCGGNMSGTWKRTPRGE